MEPAMFSLASIFDPVSENDEDNTFLEREHAFPGLVLRIREFAFHHANANLLWPGTSIFAEWIVQHEDLLKGCHILELGSGTGALSIFLKKQLELDVTTSDYDDMEIENNINHNCRLNDIAALPHIRHTWGEEFPSANMNWDVVIASDILLYVKKYPDLIQTICLLFTGYEIGRGHMTKKEVTDKVCAPEIEPDPCSFVSHGKNKDVAPSVKSSSPCVGGYFPRPPTESEPSAYSSSAIKKPPLSGLSSDEPSVDWSHPDAQVHTRNVRLTLDRGDQLPKPCFLMSWRRRIPKHEEALFFDGCRAEGFVVIDLGSRVYCIYRHS